MKKILYILLCLVVALPVGCDQHEWYTNYQLPPALPKSEDDPGEDPVEDEDGEFGNFPSLLSEEETKTFDKLSASYNTTTKLLNGGTYLATLEYVVLLFKHGSAQSLERAENTLKTILSAQVTDPKSNQYGNWPWGINSSIGDRNPPLFFARRLVGQIWPMQERMRPSMKKAYLNSINLLLYATEHRWDIEKFELHRSGVRYTNAFLLYIESLTLCGNRLNDERVKTLAKAKWDAYYAHYQQYGFDEFLSRNYSDIDFNALWGIQQYCEDDEQKEKIIEMMDDLIIMYQAVCHPKLYTPVVGNSRDDKLYVTGSDARADFIKPNKQPVGYILPSEYNTLKSGRNYPFEINGRAGDYVFTWKSYMQEKAAMGSMTGWGCYFCQNVHLMATVGTSTSARATLFVPGSNIYANGFTDQKELTALMVYNRLPTLYHVLKFGSGADISSSFFNFGIGLSTQWTTESSEVGKVVLNPSNRGYYAYLYPFVLDGSEIKPCELNSISRTKSSEKYKVEDLKFTELCFPSNSTWFGVVIKLVPTGTTPSTPVISFKDESGIKVFTTNEGHSLKIKQDKGAWTQIRDEDPLTKPLFEY